ncbi:MAG: SBBP repeat-containing protein, partial [Phycisphaerales bacterium]|nr:SBBP repeat-containing protein [Phycisphaerales bacterium]
CPNKLGFVGKLSQAGQFAGGAGWLSYLGGTTSDEAWGVAVDTSGDVFVVGDARSNDWPAQNVLLAPHPTTGGTFPTDDAFLAHVTSDGSKLDYLLYLGGTDLDYARAVTYSASGLTTGVLAIAGYTYSTDLVAGPSASQGSSAGLIDAFVTKVYHEPKSLVGLALVPIRSTYLGGAANDLGLSVALDRDGAVYVGGTTSSADFPMTIVSSLVATDGFVTKLSPMLDAVEYSRLYGGSGSDAVNGIVVDRDGRAHLTGDTSSLDLPAVDCFQCNPPGGGGNDAFYSRLAPDGTMEVSSYLGGAVGGSGLVPNDSGKAIALDPFGAVTIAGTTSSTDLPDQLIAPGAPPMRPYSAQSDAFYVGITPCGAPAVDPMKTLVTHAHVGDFLSTNDDVSLVPTIRSTWPGGPNWDIHVGATATDGLVAQDVRLGFNLNGPFCSTDDIACQHAGYRYMAPRLSMPYYNLDLGAQGTNGPQAARCELALDSASGATAADWFCRSRLVDFDIRQDARKLAVTATYEVMTEPPPPAGKKPSSCLLIEQRQ